MKELSMARTLDGINPGAYLGVRAPTPPNMIIPGNIPLSSPRSPTVNDIQYNLGDLWLNKTNQTLWYLAFLGANNAGRFATWLEFATGAGGAVISLTTDDGNVVTALAGTIIVHGAGGLVTSGTAGPNTVTITAGPTIATSYITNPATGIAIPALNILTFAGAGGIVVSAAGSTVTITGTGGTVTSLTSDDGHIVTPTAGTIIIHGTNGIVTTGTVGPNTLSVTAGSTIAQSFPTDAGTATPAAGVLNIIANQAANNAGSSVRFTGAGNTVTFNDTDANGSVFIGISAGNLTMNASAGTSVGIGALSLHGLTTGGAHTAVGYGSLQANTTGVDNCAFGNLSLDFNTSGSNNSAFGFQSLRLITTGSHNSGFGELIAQNFTTGSYNLALGSNGTAGAWTGAESSNISLMNGGVLGESNTMRIGTSGAGNGMVNRSFIAGIRGITTDANDAIAVLISSTGQLGTISSSRRYKSDIQDLGSDTDKIMQLRPVSFKFHGYDNRSVGLIAEEVEEVMPELVAHDKDGMIFSVKYNDIIPMLLNELQKLKKEVELLKSN